MTSSYFYYSSAVNNKLPRFLLSALCLLLTAPQNNPFVVVAHVSFDPSTAKSGSSFTTAFTLSHGCDGLDTLTTTVQIPDGVIAVKPERLAGFNISTTARALDTPVLYYGTLVNETVDEIVYEGSIPDWVFQTIGLRFYITPTTEDTVLMFVVTQDCGNSSLVWMDASHDDEYPAPTITVSAYADTGADDHSGHTSTEATDMMSVGMDHSSHMSGADAAASGELNNGFCYGSGKVMMPGFQFSPMSWCVLYLFQGAVVDTAGSYAGSIIGTFVLAVLVEVLRFGRSRFLLHDMKKEKPLQHDLINTTTYMIQVMLAYWIMLLVMTYEAGLFIAIVLGLGSGYFATLQYKHHYVKDMGCQCSKTDAANGCAPETTLSKTPCCGGDV
jgi:uncharacterized protein YcnI